MGTVHELHARRKLTAEEKAEAVAWFTAATTRGDLTLDDVIASDDIDAIAAPGPYVSVPGSETDAIARRVHAIGLALIGPGALTLGVAAEALGVLASELEYLASLPGSEPRP